MIEVMMEKYISVIVSVAEEKTKGKKSALIPGSD